MAYSTTSNVESTATEPYAIPMRRLYTDCGLSRKGKGSHFDNKRYPIPVDAQENIQLLFGGVSYHQYCFVTDVRGPDPVRLLCFVPEKGGEYLVAGPAGAYLTPEEQAEPESVRPNSVAYQASKAKKKIVSKMARDAKKAEKAARQKRLEEMLN